GTYFLTYAPWCWMISTSTSWFGWAFMMESGARPRRISSRICALRGTDVSNSSPSSIEKPFDQKFSRRRTRSGGGRPIPAAIAAAAAAAASPAPPAPARAGSGGGGIVRLGTSSPPSTCAVPVKCEAGWLRSWECECECECGSPCLLMCL
ncbi:hypothetical protein KEM52_002501, partial [Ascosphaera acerosa]